MASMGLSLTMKQIIDTLKNVKLVILAIVAYIITLVLPLDQSLRIGLVLLATAAGAPFLPKLVEAAKGNIAFGVGLMVLLMEVTIIYLPLVLPLILPGVAVNPMDIASSLIVLMLIPLAIGLFILMPIASEIGKRSQAT
jgi:BASS family bile acid:Na+ symporter